MQIHKSILFSCLFVFFAAYACTRHVASPSILIQSKDAQGLLSVQADGTGLTLPEREKNAQAYILREIIFNGVPSSKVSDVRLPLIEDRSKLSSKQSSEVEAVLSPGQAATYFSSFDRHPSSREWNAKNTRVERFSGQLRLDMLRKDLEKRGIIRRFGY